MSENLKKATKIFHSPGIAAAMRWSRCVHGRVVVICLLSVVSTLFSLSFTLATKGLVDGAVSSDSDALIKYGLMLLGIILVRHILSAA